MSTPNPNLTDPPDGKQPAGPQPTDLEDVDDRGKVQIPEDGQPEVGGTE